MSLPNLILPLLLLVSPAALRPLPTVPQQTYIPPGGLEASYERLAEAGDLEKLGALWLGDERQIMPRITADLDEAMELEELDEPSEEDLARIELLQRRALVGARAASRATGRPIFLDYAASFAGWNAEQRRSKLDAMVIRERCLAEIAAQASEGYPQYYSAIGMGAEVKDRALALGDWWWVAIGYELECRANEAQGHDEEAMIGYSQARLIYRDLGLLEEEFGSLKGMLRHLQTLQRWSRALPVAEAALDYARKNREAEVPELLAAKARIHRALGQEELAGACEEEIKALGGK